MKNKEKQDISMKEMLTKRSIEPITNCNCRQDKDGAFADLLNQEIEELQKAKAIEEMAQTICEFAHSTGRCDCVNNFAPNCTWKDMATSVYNAGYRKITDSVVLSKEEYEKLKSLYDTQKGAIMTSSMGDLPLTVDGLRKAVDEITRLNRVEAELQELNAKYYNEAKDLRRKLKEVSKEMQRRF